RYESLECWVLRRLVQGKMPDFGQDPLVQGCLNGGDCCGANGLASPRLGLFEPNLRVFFECYAELLFDHTVEVPHCIYFRLGDDFPCSPFSFAAIHGTRPSDGTDAFANKHPFLLTFNVLPKTHDEPSP